MFSLLQKEYVEISVNPKAILKSLIVLFIHCSLVWRHAIEKGKRDIQYNSNKRNQFNFLIVILNLQTNVKKIEIENYFYKIRIGCTKQSPW